jgi:hypothetical protein
MIYAYEIKPDRYLGNVIGFRIDDGIPLGYTRTAPPYIPKGKYARWTGMGWEITNEPPPEPEEEIRIITKLAFLNRITDDEYIAMLSASKTDVPIEAWFKKFDLMEQIVLNKLNLNLFLEKSIFTKERIDAILKSPVQDHERPN